MTIFRRLGLLAPLAALSLAGCGLNSVPTAEEKVNAEFGNLQAEYQRRNDLIGNLVETVKGAAGSESQILIQVTQARSRATSVNLTPEQLDDPQAVRAYNDAQAGLSTARSLLGTYINERPPRLLEQRRRLAVEVYHLSGRQQPGLVDHGFAAVIGEFLGVGRRRNDQNECSQYAPDRHSRESGNPAPE